MNDPKDIPGRLLAFAVRRMPRARREWGAAMLAELGAFRAPRARWSFALGCAWVAAFPPDQGGFMTTKQRTLTTSILLSTALVAPLVCLELRYAKQIYSDFPYPLFAILWLVAAGFFLTAVPLIRDIRVGGTVLARPGLLILRLGFLVLAGAFWALIVNDQMPCFLGVPNCD